MEARGYELCAEWDERKTSVKTASIQ